MEDERSDGSGISGVVTPSRSLPPRYLAGMAVLALVLAIGWSVYDRTETVQREVVAIAAAQAQTSSSAEEAASSSAAQSAAAVAQVGPEVLQTLEDDYQSLQQSGSYSSSTAQAVAQELAAQISAPVTYRTYSIADLQIATDTSYARMLVYRADLQKTLAPIATGTTPEFAIFAEYVQTQDPSYLAQLQQIADNYQAAASATAQVVVPADAVTEQLGILNAMDDFGSILQALAQNGTDPITSTILLENYEEAENDMVNSFSALAQYFAHHSNP